MSLTAEQKAYLAEVAPGRFWMEIDELFADRFGFSLSKNKIRYTLSRMGVKSGVKGREAGCDTPNSVKYKVGDEREDYKGVWVKVKAHADTKEEQKNGKLWKRKQNHAWEQANGMPLPEGYVVMFADKDRRNFDPDNLVAVPYELSLWINGKRLNYYDRASLETCIAAARVNLAVKAKIEAIKEAGI